MNKLSHGLGIMRRILSHPATRGRRIRALCRFLFWQAWERILRRPLRFRAFGEMTLVLHPHDPSCSGVFYTGLPDFEEMRFIQDVLRPGDGFLDVGANSGIYTVLGASVLGRDGRIVAVEPDPSARRVLAEQIRRNGLTGARVVPTAVGARRGWARMTRDRGSTNHVVEVGASAGEKPAGKEDWVRLDTLDEQCRGFDPFLAKVDVEGFELDVLRGASEMISARRPAAWILETNGLGRRYGDPPERLEAWVRRNGGEWYRYDPTAGRLVPTRLHPGLMNAIAVLDRPAVMARLAEHDARD